MSYVPRMRRRTAVAAGLLVASALAALPASRASAPNGDPVIATAGDIAGSGGEQQVTGDLIRADPSIDRVLIPGDIAYQKGTTAEFANYYDPAWGSFKDKTDPVPGNHEYETSGASGYFTYFGERARPGTPGAKGSYAYDLGQWRIIALNEYEGDSLGFLQSDLANTKRTCTLVFWHEPVYSGAAKNAGNKSYWDAMYAAGADVILNGHNHVYEGFEPMNPAGQSDPANGIRAFTVGTGGIAEDGGLDQSQANLRTAFKGTGILKMTLHASSYTWEYVGTGGSDTGTASCVGPQGTPPPPTTTTTLPGATTTTVAPTSTTTSTTTTTLPVNEPVDRLAGADRLATAVAISQASFGAGSAKAAVLARADDFADALAGAPLAARRGGPLLLTNTASIGSETMAELRRAVAPGSTVYVLGGPAAVHPSVETAVREAGFTVQRIAGPDRFATAVATADAAGGPSNVFVATGRSFPDALAGGAAAAAHEGTVVLTDGPVMPRATAQYLARHAAVPRFALGGAAAAADPSATPLVGVDRYETASLVAARFFPTPIAAALASGTTFADALAGAAHAGRRAAPLLLSAPDSLPAPAASYLRARRAAIGGGYLYGGLAALSAAVLDAFREAIR